MMDREERARLDELLMQRVTGALSAPEADALTQASRSMNEIAEWEAAAAELTAVMSIEARNSADALPPALADRIIGVGEAVVRTSRAASAPFASAPFAPVGIETRRRSSSRSVAIWSGWLAAAALLVWTIGSRTPGTVSPVVAIGPSSGAVLRDSLLNADSSLVRLAWTATADSSALGATGDVVWSARAQRGVMRIAGLQPNDRGRFQYQLWIFDKRRDQRYPVDGGVFDIPAGAHEVFVPIDARVPIGDAVMFAITVETPGGVVVSKRERIALLAKPAG